MKFLDEILRSGNEYNYIGALMVEGWVGIDYNQGYPRANLSIANNSTELLAWVQRIIGGHLLHSNNKGYKLWLWGERAIAALRKIPMIHEEKVAAKELVLYYADNGGIGIEALRAYQELRRRIDEEVRLYTMEARLEWIRGHGKPHKNDLDQSMPEN